MSKNIYFTQHNSPNIVIVPAKSLSNDPPQKPESEADSESRTDDTNKSIPILIQGTTSNSESCTNLNSNANMNAKNKSWASNYLQSIGLSHEKSVLNRRGKMNTSQDNAIFLTQDLPPAAVGPNQFTDGNLQTAAPNINYALGQSSSIIENNTTFPNYNNIASATGVMPYTTYPGSYENNNHYYGQPMNVVQSTCCSTCYGTVENLPNTCINTYGQSPNVAGNTSSMVTYYANAPSTLASAVNLPCQESNLFINSNTQTMNNFGQPINITDNNTSTSITPCEDKRCPTPLFDEKLLTPQLGNCINANSSLTKITDVKSCNVDDKKLCSVSNSTIEKKTCDCMYSIQNPDKHNKQNTEIQIKTNKKIDQMSSVQANEKAFRDFLRKLKIDRPSEKKQTSSQLKSPPSKKKVKKSKTKSKEKSSVEENEKAFRKLLQKLKMERKSDTEKPEGKKVIKKNTASKDQKSSHEKTMTCLEKKSSKESKQKEEERPKFIKTKYVDEQEPEYKPIKKARLDSKCSLDDYSKTTKLMLDGHVIKKYSTTKTKSTKYLDKQELECKPIKKANNDNKYDLKKKSNTRTIPTKYVDKQEPEYMPVKKQKNERDYELKKYSNTKTISTKYVDDKKHEYKQIKKTRIDRSTELTKRSDTKCDSTNLKMKRSRDESDTSDKFYKKYDSDCKIRTYKTESTKYYKYRTEDCEDALKQTPVKSVVKISKTRELKKSPINNIFDKEDLRDKLSRKLPTAEKEANDNLIITVNNNISENNMSPVNITDNLKTKTESCKKINLVINIVYKQPGSRSESDKSDSDSPQAADLSFLDDFNVDEIVASLSKTENINMYQNVQSEASNVATSWEGRAKETETSNVSIKKVNSEISKAQMILEEGNILNDLLSKEANLLDSLRIIHEEIQSEKRSCMDNEENKSFPQRPSGSHQKDSKCGTDALLKRDIKNETGFNLAFNEQCSPTESKISDVNNMSPSTNTSQAQFSVLMEQLNKIGHKIDTKSQAPFSALMEQLNKIDHDIDTSQAPFSVLIEQLNKISHDIDTSLAPFSVLMDQLNKIDHKIDSSEPINYDLLKKETKILIENENSYDYDITSFDTEDKRRQSELLKILEDTKEDEKVIQTKNKNTPQTAYVNDKLTNDMHTYNDDINSFDEEDKIGQSELLQILEDTKEDDIERVQTQTNSMPQTAYVSDEISNDISYNGDITSFDEKDKIMQSELLKVLKDTKEGEIENQTNVTNLLTIIDLSSDDSNDSYKTKQSKDQSLDDVYIVEEKSGKNIIETIDLTTGENLSNQISTQSPETAEVLKNKENKSASSNPLVKEKILLDKQKTNNKGYGKTDMFSNEPVQKDISNKIVVGKVQDAGVCLNYNESKEPEEGTVTKIVIAIKDAIASLKTTEAEVIEFPTMNTIKETFDIVNSVKGIEVTNIQDVINISQRDTEPSDDSITITMEDKNCASRMLTMDCKEMKDAENCASVTNSENTTNCDAEKDRHENDKEQIKLKEDGTLELISDVKELISNVANNTKIEETVLLQAEVDVKNEGSSSTDVTFEKNVTKTSIENCNTVLTTEKDTSQAISDIASCDKQKEKDGMVQNISQKIDSKTKVNIDEKKNTVEEITSPKAKVQNKTEASTPKTMPSTSGTKMNTPSPTTKKDETNLKAAVDVKVENANKKPIRKNKEISVTEEKLECEMYQCFKQKYNAQGLVHSGTFSKVFHFTSFSGRHYAVKSYNEWGSIYKYADKMDLLFAMQEGLMRHSYGCVYLVNSFSLQSRLCLLMDYYPKNLKQALEENGKPFHIDQVQYLARQLVSAVMQLKNHDIVHLDIKPTHILLSHKNRSLKLCGFDAARYINKIRVLPNLGTVNYRPPEVIVGFKIGFDADVWATAAVMHEMATGVKMFPGTYNNEILFKQMCTLGALPAEMLARSNFSNAHFTGSSFKRVMMNKQNKMNIITKFYKTKRLETTVMKAYNENWRSFVTQEQLAVDKEKILSFTALLRDMMVVDPRDRMPIQFVDAHPFMTESYDQV